jgi:hypothetical protein
MNLDMQGNQNRQKIVMLNPADMARITNTKTIF